MRSKGSKVDVVATTPLAGTDLSTNQIAGPVQTATAADVENSGALDLADFMNRHLNGVYLNEMQANRFQPDVNFEAVARRRCFECRRVFRSCGRSAAKSAVRRCGELGPDPQECHFRYHTGAGVGSAVWIEHFGGRLVRKDQRRRQQSGSGGNTPRTAAAGVKRYRQLGAAARRPASTGSWPEAVSTNRDGGSTRLRMCGRDLPGSAGARTSRGHPARRQRLFSILARHGADRYAGSARSTTRNNDPGGAMRNTISGATMKRAKGRSNFPIAAILLVATAASTFAPPAIARPQASAPVSRSESEPSTSQGPQKASGIVPPGREAHAGNARGRRAQSI